MTHGNTAVSVGAALRAAREGLGRSANEIADELCIMSSYVRAIEDGNLKNLPGTFFYKSFAKQYAVLVNLDPKSLHLDQAAPDAGNSGSSQVMPTGPVSTYRPPVRSVEPLVADTNSRYLPEHHLGKSIAGLVLAVLACTGFYSWWNRIPAEPVAAQPTAVEQRPATTPPADVPAPSTVSGEAAPLSSPVSMGTPVAGVVLDVSATESTWLSISSNGRQIFSGILHPSESKQVAGMDRATLKVGNAGGIEIRWNGKPIGPVGGRGQVRTVRFTPEEVQILPASDPL